MKKEHEELMELRHEPVPGYKKIFYVIFAIGVSYLCAVFLFGSH